MSDCVVLLENDERDGRKRHASMELCNFRICLLSHVREEHHLVVSLTLDWCVELLRTTAVVKCN
jgi:hypothetical protein